MEDKPTWVDAPIPPILDSEYETDAWGLKTLGGKHEPLTIHRPKATGKLVRFDMIYNGICHSDIHWGLNDLSGLRIPFVGGHEMLGKVTEVGDEVTKFKVGDHVSVGVIIGSCETCD